MIKAAYTLKDPNQPNFLPTQVHQGDAGFDIRLFVEQSDDIKSLLEDFKLSNIYFNTEKIESYSKLQITEKVVILHPHSHGLYDAGFKVSLSSDIAIPTMLLIIRSGLAIKHKLCLTNQVGVIDSGYRGWVKFGLYNASDNIHIFTHGSRIAQAIFTLSHTPESSILNPSDFGQLSTSRSLGGFGSTGV